MKLSFFSALIAASTAAAQLALHPNAAITKCLEVRGNVQANGTPVQIFECNGSPAQSWELTWTQTSLRLTNTTFCLDAGPSPGPNTPMEIQQCFGGRPSQTWVRETDNRIALLGKGLCLDLPNGNLKDATVVQTFHCTQGDTNQIWFSTRFVSGGFVNTAA